MNESSPFAFTGVDLPDLVVAHEAEVDPFTGSLRVRIPLPASTGRAGFGPALALVHRPGSGNSPFGRGWALSGAAAIVRGTRRLPEYDGSDAFRFGDVELVPARGTGGSPQRTATSGAYTVQFFTPRDDSGPLRVERWIGPDTHWRVRDGSTTTVLGRTQRIVDPAEPDRVFAWLPEARYDGIGNAMRYEYKAEDRVGVDLTDPAERAHLGYAPAQRYLARVRYGNTRPYGPGDSEPPGNDWLFELVLDYGDHPGERPLPDGVWPARVDPYSTYRPGFDLRTHRLCRRLLRFHRFAELGPDPVLVGTTVFGYDERPAGTTLVSVTHEGIRRDGTTVDRRALPPLRLTYTAPPVTTEFVDVPAGTRQNAPHGLTNRASRWVDLHGDGLPGLLTETADAWYYKPNAGGGRLGPQERLAARPALAGTVGVLADFDHDGNPDVVSTTGRLAGMATLDRTTGVWGAFRPFVTAPQTDALARQTQWLDLDGDGFAEPVSAGATGLTWFPAQGRAGFGAPRGAPAPRGSGAPPSLAESPERGVFLADLTGDGLTDLVQLGNGSLRYWPQLGHGRFGAPVTVDGAPVYAPDAEFDPARIRFVDLDGSGTADIVYLGRGVVRRWRNAAGNRFEALPDLTGTPYLDRSTTADIVDFLGDGSACLVWSSPLPGSAPVRYAPLSGPLPAGLLVRLDNSVGGEVRVTYESSIVDLLRDRAAGRDWHTKLPRHPLVVRRRELVDRVTGSTASTRYAYHDGVFDGTDQAFRGFGWVDAYDADSAADELAEDPTVVACTRTWYHTGTPLALDGAYAGPAVLPPVTYENLDALDTDGYAEAQRCLSGRVRRAETYADGATVPFHVIQYRYLVRRGPAGPARAYAVETVRHMYEQQPDTPRVTQRVVAELDPYGQVRVAAEVAYPRAGGTPEQAVPVATAERFAWSTVDTVDRYELAVTVAQEDFELGGIGVPTTALPLGTVWPGPAVATALAAALATPRDPTSSLPDGAPTARRTRWERTRYWSSDRTGPLPLGQVGSPVLPHHTESAAFSATQVTAVFGAALVTDPMLTGLGYSTMDGYWWRPQPVLDYHPASAFSRPAGSTRFDGAQTRLGYDPSWLDVVSHTDATQQVSTVDIDYQLLTPRRITDANGAVEEVRHDALGVIVATSSRGTVDGHAYGDDPLPTVVALPNGAVDLLLTDAAPVLTATGLRGAGEVVAYDFPTAAGAPGRVVRVTRQELAHDGRGGGSAGSPLSVRIAYYDGYGRVAQHRERVAPGQWLASGTVVYDAKQLPVREYEPWYGPSPAFEPDSAVARVGVARRRRYDAVARVVRVDEPDGSYSRMVHRAWQTEYHDRNDTVDDSLYRLSRDGLPDTDPAKQALLAAREHAGTPTVHVLDPAARVVREIASDGTTARTIRTRRDSRGEPREVFDGRGILALRHVRDLCGRLLYELNYDAGQVWFLPDAADRPAHRWDSRGVHTTTGFDRLDRTVTVRVGGATGPTRLVESLEYGAGPDAATRNAVGRPVRHRDPSGERTYPSYTPSGQVRRAEFRVCAGYADDPDWTDPARVLLDDDVHVSEAAYDALDRLAWQHLPDGTIRRYTYAYQDELTSIRIGPADGSTPEQAVLSSATYDARGERTGAVLGNGVTLAYEFDPETLRTRRATAQRADGRWLRDLRHTYDPMGNLLSTVDMAQEPGAPTPLLTGATATTRCEYRYDALYRLTSATGRVHQALLESDYRTGANSFGGFLGTRHLSLNNGQAVERYTQRFRYDPSDNLTQLKHEGTSRGWTTDMWTSATSNRSLPALDRTGAPVTNPEDRFDAGGNPRWLPHVESLDWAYHGRLASAVVVDRSDRNLPDDAEFYRYGADGLRTRKVSQRVVDTETGAVETVDKLYLDGCELVRVRRGGQVTSEYWTSHVDDGTDRLAMIRRDTATGVIATRYPLGDRLGSAVLELDGGGAVLSYEEFFPYGGTAFLAGDDLVEVKRKEHRFRGAERDDLTGLYYGGHRYYAPWLGRWLSPDPSGTADGLNQYAYCRDNPITYRDPDGLASVLRTPSGSAAPAGQQSARPNLTSELLKIAATLPPHQRAQAEQQIRDKAGVLAHAQGATLNTIEFTRNGRTIGAVRLDIQEGSPPPSAPVGETALPVVPPPQAPRKKAPPAQAAPPSGPPPAAPPDSGSPDDPNELKSPPPADAMDPESTPDAPDGDPADQDPMDEWEQPDFDPEGMDPDELEPFPEDEENEVPPEESEEEPPSEEDGDDAPMAMVGSIETGFLGPAMPEELSDTPPEPHDLRSDFIDGFLDQALQTAQSEVASRLLMGLLGPAMWPILAEQMGRAVEEAYHEGGGGWSGIGEAANLFNPLSHALRAGYLADQEAEQALYLQKLGDTEGAARHSQASGGQYFNVVFQSVLFGMTVAGMAKIAAPGKGPAGPADPPGGYGPKRIGPVAPGESGPHAVTKPRATGTGMDSHHIPQASAGFTTRGAGGAILMWQRLHKMTRTYGWRGALLKIWERRLPWRQRVAADLKDMRRISMQESGSTRMFNKGLQNLMNYYRQFHDPAIRNRVQPRWKGRQLTPDESNWLKANMKHLNMENL